MTAIYTLNTVSGQVGWVDEEYLDHPVFGKNLIEVPYGTKSYLLPTNLVNEDVIRERVIDYAEKVLSREDLDEDELAELDKLDNDHNEIVLDPPSLDKDDEDEDLDGDDK